MPEDTTDRQGLFGGLRLVALVAAGEPMRPPAQVVYSTSPECWLDADGREYVVKGPEVEIVAAEMIAHLLGAELGLPLPSCALARKPDGTGPFFGSCLVTDAMRDVVPWLRPRPTAILSTVARITAFDVWIANGDRNVSNLIARPGTDPDVPVEILAIDFEKAHCLRDRHARITTPMIEVRSLWPKGVLGELLKSVPLPSEFVSKMIALGAMQIETLISRIAPLLGPGYNWYESTISALVQRQTQLAKLVREVWR